MKRQIRFHLLAAAVVCAAPLGFAQARDLLPAAASGEFQRAAAMPRSQVDQRGYQEPLYKEFTMFDIPRESARVGAYGPIREEFNPQGNLAREQEQQQIWNRMYPIGGSDTP